MCIFGNKKSSRKARKARKGKKKRRKERNTASAGISVSCGFADSSAFYFR